jgi:uncharacterized membrane protein YbaN (DUF454 family)
MNTILQNKMKYPVLLVGWLLLLLGVIGLVLPLLPGIPLLIAGLVILSREYDWARRLLAKGLRWLPAVSEKIRRFWWRVRMPSTQRSPQRPQGRGPCRPTENQ